MYYSNHIFRSNVPDEGGNAAGDEKMQTAGVLHMSYMDIVKMTLTKEELIYEELDECVLSISWEDKTILIAAQEEKECLQVVGRARVGLPAEKRPAAYELMNSLNEEELVQCFLDANGDLKVSQILVLADSVLSKNMVLTTLGHIWRALEAGFEPLMKLRYS